MGGRGGPTFPVPGEPLPLGLPGWPAACWSCGWCSGCLPGTRSPQDNLSASSPACPLPGPPHPAHRGSGEHTAQVTLPGTRPSRAGWARGRVEAVSQNPPLKLPSQNAFTQNGRAGPVQWDGRGCLRVQRLGRPHSRTCRLAPTPRDGPVHTTPAEATGLHRGPGGPGTRGLGSLFWSQAGRPRQLRPSPWATPLPGRGPRLNEEGAAGTGQLCSQQLQGGRGCVVGGGEGSPGRGGGQVGPHWVGTRA